MITIEALQDCRAYRAKVYADAAARLAEAVVSDPAGPHWDRYESCRAAWNVLCAVDNRIRAFVIAGDPIDDYYRLQEVPSATEPSYADKVNATAAHTLWMAIGGTGAPGEGR